ncbi:MAG: TonB-dependent receptor, partial [Bacteroidales bacterium]|nr:TonB-dependent receptor [Bacteroidales bacterium]
VVISERASGSHISRMEPILTNVITKNELQKAACCNLSESFETNASVDVSYSDAVSGAKQIQLLGLAGIHSQLMTENIPSVRGLAQPFGLSYIPGPWMDAIQVSKGAAAVVNGYESITGQINVELKKPENTEKFFLNAYANDLARMESSITSGVKISDDFYGMVLLHGELAPLAFDHNHDGFMDHPVMKKYNLVNRYKYNYHGVWESMFGFKLMEEERIGGQMGFENEPENNTSSLFGFNSDTKRFEAFAKNGFFFKNRQATSLGTIVNFSHHDLDSKYGQRMYDATQDAVYVNLIFETPLDQAMFHKLNAGLSYSFDRYEETLADSAFKRDESVPGIFAQYTFNNPSETFTLIAGVRGDWHNIYGLFVTPRLHFKYKALHNTTIRGSIGKGYRAPALIAENLPLLVSSRKMVFSNDIAPEQAWNYGLSISQHFELGNREASFTVEAYRTDFINQVIIDLDSRFDRAYFGNLDGKSFSNSIQAELNLEPIRQLDVTLAYRMSDVKQTVNGKLEKKPFVNAYKGLVSLSYLTLNKRWQFDFTSQFNGKARIPDTSLYPEQYQLDEYSPAYTIINAQITHKFKAMDIYLGAENITGFTQKHPVLAYDDPYGPYFDASMIWGPITGRMFYLGLRYHVL